MLKLKIKPPFPPMEAASVERIPVGENWEYEPKWDGFRCLTFRDQASIELQSKSGQPLARYFPDVIKAVLEIPAKQFVLDGEILIVTGKGLISFEDLLLRIHPASSRVKTLAETTPATLMVFDLLLDEKGRSLVDQPLKVRRERLEQFAARYFKPSGQVLLSPKTLDIKKARIWLAKAGGGLDGVIAKRLDLPYLSAERKGMEKIKKIRTADCVVGGFRYASQGKLLGSLLLGLYDRAGLLNHVGFTSSLSTSEKEKVTPRLEKLIKEPGFTGKAPGGPSRWSTKRSSEWIPLDPSLVVEVEYDHFSEGRFRHGTKLMRFRPDKDPRQCTLAQVSGGAKGSNILRQALSGDIP
jgi:ATP-dependent DNA ligase